MTTTVTECYSVGEKLHDIGCLEPRGLVLLPINLELASSIGELRQAAETATLRKLLKRSGVVPEDVVDRSQRLPTIQNKSYEWIPPTIFVAAALWTENPNSVSVALGVIANYATDFFRGRSGEKSVNLDIIAEHSKNRNCKKVSYNGPASGLKELADIVRAAADD
jgi:hypothetical protein